eukprot:Skav204070  [mRNA]  locus=scaffold3:531547:537559:- [translate_table: standard]
MSVAIQHQALGKLLQFHLDPAVPRGSPGIASASVAYRTAMVMDHMGKEICSKGDTFFGRRQGMAPCVHFKHAFCSLNNGKLDDFYKAIDRTKIADGERFQTEVDIQRGFRRSLAVKHSIAVPWQVFVDAKKVYLVMELCTGGELFDRILEEAEKHEGAAV